jgi:hypothetical protein
MSQQELLKQVIDVLNRLGVEYMATGSVVSSLQGQPRATHDVDLLVAMPATAVAPLAAAFPPPSYYLTEDSIRDALQGRSMFNLLHLDQGDKVDFWILTDEPFDQSRFARKRPVDALGMRLVVSTPEDTILAKLKWCQLAGGSEKQFTDALQVYEVQQGKLAEGYLTRWVAQLGVQELWERLRQTANPG